MSIDSTPAWKQSPSESPGGEKLVKATGRTSDDCMYTLQWSDGYTNRYPFVWLFDNCRCSACFHPSTNQRINSMAHVDPEVKPTTEKITEDGELFEVSWREDHVGEYPSAWLRDHRFNKGTVFDPLSDLKMKPWGAELGDKIPRFEYGRVMTNNDVLFDWLRALYETGLALVTDAPRESGVLDILTTRVAYLKETDYGRVFQIYTKSSMSSVACTTEDLGLHVDAPYPAYAPEVQMLHCIRQFNGSGGDNQFADAYKAAIILKENNPDVYRTLTTVPIHSRGCGVNGREYHAIGAKKTIEEDEEGNFKGIFFSDLVRASYMNVPVEKIQDVYRALKLLNVTLYQNGVQYKLKEGEIATFSNLRVLHGRKGFTLEPSDGGVGRFYERVYMDWDSIFSRMRVLHEEKHGELRL